MFRYEDDPKTILQSAENAVSSSVWGTIPSCIRDRTRDTLKAALNIVISEDIRDTLVFTLGYDTDRRTNWSWNVITVVASAITKIINH